MSARLEIPAWASFGSRVFVRNQGCLATFLSYAKGKCGIRCEGENHTILVPPERLAWLTRGYEEGDWVFWGEDYRVGVVDRVDPENQEVLLRTGERVWAPEPVPDVGDAVILLNSIARVGWVEARSDEELVARFENSLVRKPLNQFRKVLPTSATPERELIPGAGSRVVCQGELFVVQRLSGGWWHARNRENQICVAPEKFSVLSPGYETGDRVQYGANYFTVRKVSHLSGHVELENGLPLPVDQVEPVPPAGSPVYLANRPGTYEVLAADSDLRIAQVVSRRPGCKPFSVPLMEALRVWVDREVKEGYRVEVNSLGRVVQGTVVACYPITNRVMVRMEPSDLSERSWLVSYPQESSQLQVLSQNSLPHVDSPLVRPAGSRVTINSPESRYHGLEGRVCSSEENFAIVEFPDLPKLKAQFNWSELKEKEVLPPVPRGGKVALGTLPAGSFFVHGGDSRTRGVVVETDTRCSKVRYLTGELAGRLALLPQDVHVEPLRHLRVNTQVRILTLPVGTDRRGVVAWHEGEECAVLTQLGKLVRVKFYEVEEIPPLRRGNVTRAEEPMSIEQDYKKAKTPEVPPTSPAPELKEPEESTAPSLGSRALAVGLGAAGEAGKRLSIRNTRRVLRGLTVGVLAGRMTRKSGLRGKAAVRRSEILKQELCAALETPEGDAFFSFFLSGTWPLIRPMIQNPRALRIGDSIARELLVQGIEGLGEGIQPAVEALTEVLLNSGASLYESLTSEGTPEVTARLVEGKNPLDFAAALKVALGPESK